MTRKTKIVVSALLLLTGITGIFFVSRPVEAATLINPNSGGIGMEGRNIQPPPTTGATISIPTNGAVFNNIPIIVTGLCPTDLLVKLYRNGVFAGSQQCDTGSFSITTDLFVGSNELIARVFDGLDQPGPDSNMVTVTFNDPIGSVSSRITLTSNFAKRGADPGSELTWPIQISGGNGPYALSIDWGDGKTVELKSVDNAGLITLKHTYDKAGVYKIIVKATDKSGAVAYLQLVGIGNGPVSSDNANKSSGTVLIQKRILWEPALILVPLIITTFWLGQRYKLKKIRGRVARGLPPI